MNQTPVADEPPRLRRPDRRQVLLQPCCLEDLLPPEHEFRTLWAVVAKLDLSAFYAPLRCRGSSPGRGATDPQLLVGLWLAGATCGVGQARALARLCEHDERFKWMCGGVSVNHHTLGDFRVGHAGALDALFTSVLALLMAEGLVHVDRITQPALSLPKGTACGSGRPQGTAVSSGPASSKPRWMRPRRRSRRWPSKAAVNKSKPAGKTPLMRTAKGAGCVRTGSGRRRNVRHASGRNVSSGRWRRCPSWKR